MRTSGSTGSRLLRRPLGCVIVTTPRSTTRPLKETVPLAGASTLIPTAASRSTPRWPAVHADVGARKLFTTRRTPATGASRRAVSYTHLRAHETRHDLV